MGDLCTPLYTLDNNQNIIKETETIHLIVPFVDALYISSIDIGDFIILTTPF